MDTPSSSAPSPVAVGLGWPSASESIVAPRLKPVTTEWRAPLAAFVVP
jgi:hypothetical protein